LFQLAVVAVGAAIHPRVEKLRRQVTMAGDHFHTVNPGLIQAPCRSAVAGDDLVDHCLVKGARHHPEAFVGHPGSRVSHRQQTVGRLHDFPPRMENLRQHHGAVGVAGFGQSAIAVDAAVIGGHQHMGGVAGAVVHPGHLQHNQPHAAFGACPVVGDQLLVDLVVGGHRGVVPAGHDAIFQAFAAQYQRFKKMRKGMGRHGADTPGAVVIIFL